MNRLPESICRYRGGPIDAGVINVRRSCPRAVGGRQPALDRQSPAGTIPLMKQHHVPAARDAIELIPAPDPTDVAQTMQALFGQQLTAVMVGVPNPTLVGKWARGEDAPPPDVARRLIRTVRTVDLLKERQSDEDVQVWFVGQNSQLGGRAPALVVATDPDRVEDAVCAFLAY